MFQQFFILVSLVVLFFDFSLSFKLNKDVKRRDKIQAKIRRTPLATVFPKIDLQVEEDGSDLGQPLILTPLIDAGKIRDAQKASRVRYLGVTGYSGYITVNQSCASNMYFWYFPPMNGDNTAPLIMWLQGGPGGPSIFGLFVEHGPYFVDKSGNVHKRNNSWTSKFGVVYVDNPVGTGFSFTNQDSCYSSSQDDVATNLYNFLQQFYKLFPNVERNPFYVMGESYGGKYVPSISYKIHRKNRQSRQRRKIKIPLAGMAIGDGFVDPPSMSAGYASLMFQVGLLDENQRDTMEGMMARAVSLERQGLHLQSFKVFDEALNGDLTPYPSYFRNCTGTTNYFNYLESTSPKNLKNYEMFVKRPEARRLLHVGAQPMHSGTTVEQHLLSDFMQGQATAVETLLNAGYRTLFYNGNLDVIVGLPLTERLLWSGLNWNGKATYRRAERKIWKVSAGDTEVAGYVRKANNLYQVAVRNAGHMVPYDQPKRAFDMIDRFLNDRF